MNLCHASFVKALMRKMAGSVLAVCALASTVAFAGTSETERVSRTLKLDPGGTLRLRSFSGRVTITASDQPEIVIDAVRHGSRDRLDRVKLDIHNDSPTVVVVDANRRERSWWDFAGRSTVVETDFDIKVPRRTNLDISVFSAPVTVQGVEGSHKVHSFSSRLTLDDVVGPIKAHTFSGPVEIRSKTWQDKQRVDVHTFSGSVTLHVPESAHGDVSFDSFSGRLTAEMPLTLHNKSRRSLKARLGAPSKGESDGILRVKTFSGNFKIDR